MIASRRINVLLPVSTVAALDRVAAKGTRSALIDRAIKRYVTEEARKDLRSRLKAEALANAERDRSIAEDWSPLEEEAWLLTEGGKSTRAGARSTSSSSTRR